jgi:hypothetical protein
METFVLDPRQWRIARVFSTNPLVRRTDRIEALAVVLAVMISLLALPVAAVAATTVYQAQHRMYAEQARARHPVTVTTIEIPKATDGAAARAARATGSAAVPAGGGFVPMGGTARTVDPGQIWVDDHGNRVSPPTPLSRAQFDAVSVAVSIAAGSIVVTTWLVAATRRRLDRVRDTQWNRELGHIFDGEDGRANGPGYGRAP